MPKVNKNKSSRNKNLVKPPLIADVVGCSEVMVRQVLKGERSGETELGGNILIAERLLNDGANRLIEEVKRIVKF